MMFGSRFHVQGSRLDAMFSIGIQALLLFVALSQGAGAQDLKAEAEAEGKLMFYATFNAADSKTLTDGFKQAYPKIDAIFYRSTDSALMERILTENRAGQHLWDVVVTTSFYGHNLKKRGLLAAYDSPERKFYRERAARFGAAGDMTFSHLRPASFRRSSALP